MNEISESNTNPIKREFFDNLKFEFERINNQRHVEGKPVFYITTASHEAFELISDSAKIAFRWEAAPPKINGVINHLVNHGRITNVKTITIDIELINEVPRLDFTFGGEKIQDISFTEVINHIFEILMPGVER